MKISFKVFQLNLPRILILILFLINLLLTTLPLTNTLSYESSVINGIVLFIFGGILIISQQRKYFVTDIYELLNKNRNFFILSIAVTIIIGWISSRVNSRCPINDGLLFYLIITVPSLLFGGIVGNFSVALSRRFAFIIFVLIFIVTLCSPILEFFCNPQIYFYNPIFGFFPGTVYDEDLSVDRILVAYRIFNLAFFLFLFYASGKLVGKKLYQKILFIFLMLIIIIGFEILKPTLLFTTNKTRLERNLHSTIITQNFQIHFPDSLNRKNEILFAALLHQYYLEKVHSDLNLSTKQKIDSYLFSNKDQKRKLLGSGNADIAKPWLNQIYLNYSNYKVTLKHELVHAVAAEFGVTPFKVGKDFNPAMIEGFAMSIENNYDGFPVHFMAKLAFDGGYKSSIENLFTGLNFFGHASSISYIYAGSFIKYLEDKYGIEKVKKLYGTDDYINLFGEDLKRLSLDYEKFLKDYQIKFNKNQAQLYFGGITIFKKFCPRIAASDVKKAWEKFEDKNYSAALSLFKNVYDYSNSYQSFIGILTCYLKQKEYTVAEKLLDGQIKYFRSSPYFYNLELILADLLIRIDKPNQAEVYYDSLLAQKPHIEYTNEVLIRKTILAQGLDSLKTYFDKNEGQKYQKLLIMNSEKIKYFSIPLILKLAEIIKKNPDELINKMLNEKDSDYYEASYAKLTVSKYLLSQFDYDKAQYFAVRSINNNRDENYNYEFIENLRMVNWFKNFAEETIKTFRFTR